MPKKGFVLTISVILWIAAVGFGLHKLWRYSSDPGAAAIAPENWPADSQISFDSDRATLLMFAHPHCPCSRASIGELALIMTHCKGRLTAYVLFYKPKDFPVDWEKSDLWESAAAIPGVKVLQDDDGIEARRFQASTSGETLLFDERGSLLFSGGITASRGHSGDNAGRSAIVSLLTEGTAEERKTVTFGCSIYDPSSACEEEKKLCDK
jgi:hypothetical protein